MFLCVIVVIGIVTVIFGKLIGPNFLDWTLPWFNKITNKIDYAITGKPEEWEVGVREIIESNSEELRAKADDVMCRFANSRTSNTHLTNTMAQGLPESVKKFFDTYESLTFDGETKILDSSALSIVCYKRIQYLVIGQCEDSEHFYAVELKDKSPVVVLEVDTKSRFFSVEENARSLEHFVLLQYELYRSGISL